MKKFLTLSIAAAMGLTLCACGSDSSSSGSSTAETSAAVTESKELSAPEKFLEDIRGTYEELFPVINDSKYDQLWLDKCEAVVGKDNADMSALMLKNSCVGTVYGEEAVKAYTDKPDSIQFDCYFINGVSKITFDGNKISGTDKNGSEVFSHEYSYVKDLSLSGMMDGYLYETSDTDAGEFKYFFMMSDTPDTTYHLEFRYGSDIDALSKYNEGVYAYWLAAAIPTERDEKLVENCIALFTEENLSGQEEENAEQPETAAE